MNTRPLEVAPSIGVAWIIIVALLAMLIGWAIYRGRKSRWGPLFAVLMLVVLLPISWIMHRYKISTEVRENQSLRSLEVHTQNSIPSTEDLWNKLTESRINLDETEETTEEETFSSEAEDTEESADRDEPSVPEWVAKPPKTVGNIYRQVLTSDPFSTATEGRQQLEAQLLEAVGDRVEHVAAGELGRPVEVDSPLPIGISLEYIFRNVCRDEFTETVESSVGDMKKVHLLLEFDPAVDRELQTAWLKSERQARITSVAKAMIFCLTGLAVVYGLLRFDTATRGYYTWQLLFGSMLAGIVLTVYLLNIVWAVSLI